MAGKKILALLLAATAAGLFFVWRYAPSNGQVAGEKQANVASPLDTTADGGGLTNLAATTTPETIVEDNGTSLYRTYRSNKVFLQDTIYLERPLKLSDLNEEDVAAASAILGWTDTGYCGEFRNPQTGRKGKIVMRISRIASTDGYVLAIGCRGSLFDDFDKGDNYLFYYYSEKPTPVVRKLFFEYFEKDTSTGKYTRHISFFPQGRGWVDKSGQLITQVELVPGRCGYEFRYRISDGETRLTGAKADWNCDDDSLPESSWKEENIGRMRRQTSEVFDEVREFNEAVKKNEPAKQKPNEP